MIKTEEATLFSGFEAIALAPGGAGIRIFLGQPKPLGFRPAPQPFSNTWVACPTSATGPRWRGTAWTRDSHANTVSVSPLQVPGFLLREMRVRAQDLRSPGLWKNEFSFMPWFQTVRFRSPLPSGSQACFSLFGVSPEKDLIVILLSDFAEK